MWLRVQVSSNRLCIATFRVATPTAWSRKMTVNFDLALSSTNVIYHIDFVEFDHSFHLFILFYTLHTQITHIHTEKCRGQTSPEHVSSQTCIDCGTKTYKTHVQYNCIITADNKINNRYKHRTETINIYHVNKFISN